MGTSKKEQRQEGQENSLAHLVPEKAPRIPMGKLKTLE